MDSLEDYLKTVIKGMRATESKYASLMHPNLKTHSIPYFGDIESARILTVGVNPSASEFSKKRHWPQEISASELKDRLQRYFRCDPDLPTPHPWFKTWSDAFTPLEFSYQDGAAHIDLSPRTTASMGGANRDTFLAMMKDDSKWFFELLPKCRAARLMLVAGSVTGRYYMDEFVECIAHRHGYKLEKPPTPRGEGFGFNRLHGPGVDLPIFFSSLSPSSPKVEQRQELIKRIANHQERLLVFINEQPAVT